MNSVFLICSIGMAIVAFVQQARLPGSRLKQKYTLTASEENKTLAFLRLFCFITVSWGKKTNTNRAHCTCICIYLHIQHTYDQSGLFIFGYLLDRHRHIAFLLPCKDLSSTRHWSWIHWAAVWNVIIAEVKGVIYSNSNSWYIASSGPFLAIRSIPNQTRINLFSPPYWGSGLVMMEDISSPILQGKTSTTARQWWFTSG